MFWLKQANFNIGVSQVSHHALQLDHHLLQAFRSNGELWIRTHTRNDNDRSNDEIFHSPAVKESYHVCN